MFVMKRLEKVALAVAEGGSKEERKQILHIKLTEAKQHFPETFKLPLNPQRNVSSHKFVFCQSHKIVVLTLLAYVVV